MAVVACATLAVASIVSVPVLHAVQRATGAVTPPVPERAFLANPTLTALGVSVGQAIEVDVVPANDHPFRYTTTDAGRPGRSGRLEGAPGSTIVLEVATGSASPNTWFTISVGGLSRPLRVWIT